MGEGRKDADWHLTLNIVAQVWQWIYCFLIFRPDRNVVMFWLLVILLDTELGISNYAHYEKPDFLAGCGWIGSFASRSK